MLKITVKAKGTKNYKAATKTVTIKVPAKKTIELQLQPSGGAALHFKPVAK